VGLTQHSGEAKIRDLGQTTAAKKNVRRLEVPVDDVASMPILSDEGMCPGEGFGDADSDVEDHRLRKLNLLAPHSFNQPLKTSPIDKLHRDMKSPVRHTDVKDIHDVGVPEIRAKARLVQQALGGLSSPPARAEELQRHRLGETLVRGGTGTPDLPRPALTQ